jgi:hypothetical protein
MGKVFGILLLVLCVWVAVEVYTNGVDGAFGGIFAQLGGPQASAVPHDGRTLPQRVGDKVRTELQQANDRRMGESER